MQNPVIRFIEETHEYFVEEVKYPSVNEILAYMGLMDFSKVPAEKLARSQKFGKAVHYATALDDIGKLDMATLSEPLIPHLESWHKFKKDYGYNFDEAEIEQKMVSTIWKIAGTPDRYKIMAKNLDIVDLKSGTTVYDVTDLQLGGYEVIIPEWLDFKPKKIKRLIVQTTDTGIPNVKECKDFTDRVNFLSYRNCYYYEKKHGVKRAGRE